MPVPPVKVPVTVIAIDGPSGSGKGTVARRVAEELGYHLLDSGALYRVTAISANNGGVALDDMQAVVRIARNLNVRFDSDEDGSERIWLDDEDVTLEVRRESTGAGASIVAAIGAVRDVLLDRQRAFQKAPGLEVRNDDEVGPSTRETAGRDIAAVGRIRQDPSVENGILLWVTADTLRLAAVNAAKIAETRLGTG